MNLEKIDESLKTQKTTETESAISTERANYIIEQVKRLRKN